MTRWLLQGASIVALFGLGSAGCSAAPESPESGGEESGLGQSIVGGAVDTGHTNVFGLVVHEADVALSCTATLLAPNLLLTARHCVTEGVEREVICGNAGFGATYSPEHVFATNAAQFHASASWFKGKEILVPAEGDDTCGFDIALVVLSANVPSAVAKPAVPRIDREVVEGEPYVAVGYGVSEDGGSGSRMMRSGLSVGCDPGSCGLGVRGSEFVGDTGICEGDSGGPALDEAGKVVGVVSRGAEDCSLPVYASVSAWRTFIFDVATHAAALGAYQVPFWVKSGSSDPPAAPDPLPPPKSRSGEPCFSTSDCAEDSACHAESGNQGGTCVTLCSTREDCPSDLTCEALGDGSARVCLQAARARQVQGEIRSSCAFGRAPCERSLPLGTLLAGSLFARRRRRRMSSGSLTSQK